MRKILILAAASVVSAFCWGQVPDMAPGAEVQKFDWLIGNWETSGVWHIEGMEMNAESTLKVEWDGQFLRHTTITDFGGMKMTETLMFGYDPNKKKYYSSAFTNMAPMPRIEWGELKGDKLVMISEPWEIRGDISVSRAIITKVSNDEYKFSLEFKLDDEWNLINESTFKRKK